MLEGMRRGMIVLAGGRSRRMGRDKPWLEVGDQTALGRVVQAGLDAPVDVVVVVGSPGRELPPLPASVTRVDDPTDRTFEGPLSGLAVGLEQLVAVDVELACFAACDALWLGVEHVRFVLDDLEGDPEHDAVVPHAGSKQDGSYVLHPLCAAVRVEVAHRMARSLLRTRERAARALLGGLHARRVPVSALPQPRAVQGCNTPEQWAEAVASLSAPPAVE